MSVDLAIIARDLKLPTDKVEKTVQLLDDGNTIPFITRYRKDETGGLNEKQIQSIKQSVSRKRTLAERKAFILKSIESMGKLTDELKTNLEKANTTRRLEDLYLPFKPKKQTLATVARQKGLEPLANEIFEGKSAEVDLAARATNFVRVDKGLSSVDEVIAGVGHILAERFTEITELRSELRKVLWNTGQFASQAVVETENETSETTQATLPAATDGKPDETPPLKEVSESKVNEPTEATPESTEAPKPTEPTVEATAEATAENASPDTLPTDEAPKDAPDSATKEADATSEAPAADTPAETPAAAEPVATEVNTNEANTTETNSDSASTENSESTKVAAEPGAGATAPATDANATAGGAKKKKKKKKKKKAAPDPFKEYHDFKQPVNKATHHRVLAINRGERAGKLKVKIEFDQTQVDSISKSRAISPEHPSREFMEKCLADAVNKSIVPSLEREIRRELTEAAEKQAVEVFASNLKNLLLQPPVGPYRVLAIDPGFKRGCSVAILDETGQFIADSMIFVVGNQKRKDESAEKLSDLVRKHDIDIIAIGNGTACRETERLVSDVLTDKLQDRNVKYVILNEAGASTYSTSEIAREELPDQSPNIRSAVSIGRRLLDPLSELVKISPANIGVGMYQHDVKAKHLSESLDEVVEFCVNRVGVNVNTASPSLLRYVSGLNQLTARRIYEYRQEKGAFNNRQQLKEVTGFGDATFVQAVGFLRIHDGEQPLDSTSIHPESYEVAEKILTKVGTNPEQMFRPLPAPAEEPAPAPTPKVVIAKTEALAEAEANTSSDAPTPTEPAAAPESTVAPPADASTASDATDATPAAAETTDETTKAESAPVPSAETTPTVSETAPASEAPASESPATETTETVQGAEKSDEPESTPSTAATDTAAPVVDATAGSEIQTEAAAKPAGSASDSTPKPAARKVSISTSPPRKRKLSPKYDPQRDGFVAQLKQLNIRELATEYSVGNLLVEDILKTCSQPKRDPRDGVSKPIFRSGIIKVDDLKPEMQLDAQVVNVVDFGVFVDIGLGESCLVHVSQLSNRFIRNPNQFFAVGDVIKVWVTEVDSERRRVKLTAIKPGTPKFDPAKGRKRPSSKPRSQSERASRPPRSRDSKGGNRRSKTTQNRYDRSRKRPPKPVKPITKEMLDGKEPMRSFSDLLQFVEKKPDSNADKSDDK